MTEALDIDLEEFIVGNSLDQEAEEALWQCEPEIWKEVMARGSVSDCRNPTAVIRQRINDAKAGNRIGECSEEVEDFIATNNLDEKAVLAMRSAAPHVQRIVIERGALIDARNPSAALLSRLRDAQSGKSKAPVPQVAAADPREIDDFIAANELDERAVSAFQTAAPHVQRAVMDRGSLNDARNPSAALLSRLSAAQSGSGRLPERPSQGKGTYGVARQPERQPDMYAGYQDKRPSKASVPQVAATDPQEIDDFIAANELDERAVSAFLTAAPHVQRAVMDRGSLNDARNPSAALLSRLSAAQSGSSGKGWAPPTRGGNDAYRGGRQPEPRDAGVWGGNDAYRGGRQPEPRGAGVWGGNHAYRGKGTPEPRDAGYGRKGATGGRHRTLEQDLGEFIASNRLDQEAEDALWQCEPDIWREVMARGSVSDCRNPTAVIKRRISDAMAGQRIGECSQEIEDFIALSDLDEKAILALRSAAPNVQQAVVDRGPLVDARNPSAALLGRLRDAQSGKVSAPRANPREIDDFLASNDLDQRAIDALLSAAPQYQKMVIDRGSLTGANNPSAALLSRLREAQNGKTPMPPAKHGYGKGRESDYQDRSVPAGKGWARDSREPRAHAASEYSGWGAKASPGQNWAPASSPQTSSLHWLSFGPELSLVEQGFSETAPMILYDKNDPVFQSAHHILQDAVGDVSMIRMEHDEDWQLFPVVGEEFKRQTGEENCFAVAISEEHGKWAAGFHAGKKGRDSAAKLALAVAIASGTDVEGRLRRNYPEFAALLHSSAAASLQGGMKRKAPAMEERPRQMTGGPCPPVHWLTITGSSPRIVDAGFPGFGPAVFYDKAFASSFNCAVGAMHVMLGGMEPEIEHDPDWLAFPEIGAALTAAGAEENCYAVAMCPNSGKWAAGVGGSWKARESAVRLAISLAVGAESPVLEEAMNQFPDFGNLCATAGIGPDSQAWKKPKH